MSAKRDYYEILGVSKSSSPSEIKAQYRKLALKFHPDRNKSEEASEHFKEISEAYAVLSDAEKRKLYDQHGHSGVDGKYSQDDIFRGARGNFSDVFGDIFGQRGGFDSIFSSIFGGGFGRSGQMKGGDLIYNVEVTLEDVLHGRKIELDLKTNVNCENCRGTGCHPGTSPRQCGNCGGQGQVRRQHNTQFASFVTAQACGKCRGQGRIIEKPCGKCKGSGMVKSIRRAMFNLPPGIDNGDYELRGEGEGMPGGVDGDLILRVRVKPHAHFKRDGRDIHYDERISIIDAALGKEIIVPVLGGREKVKIKPGSQPNDIIRLKGKGVKHINASGRGDQYVRLVVEIPTKLSKAQKRLLEEFEAESMR